MKITVVTINEGCHQPGRVAQQDVVVQGSEHTQRDLQSCSADF